MVMFGARGRDWVEPFDALQLSRIDCVEADRTGAVLEADVRQFQVMQNARIAEDVTALCHTGSDWLRKADRAGLVQGIRQRRCLCARGVWGQNA